MIIGGHRHRSQFRRYPTSDIDICYSDIGDKYVGLENVIPISEMFRYRHRRKKNISPCRVESAPLRMVSEHYNIELLWLSDVRSQIKLYSLSRYLKFRYQAQSDIADHGYRTKCPPMHMIYRFSHHSQFESSLIPDLYALLLFQIVQFKISNIVSFVLKVRTGWNTSF
jgi:hypothetical protein